jgi:hypothetical protein
MANPPFSGILLVTVGMTSYDNRTDEKHVSKKRRNGMTTQQSIDQAKTDAFVGKVLAI